MGCFNPKTINKTATGYDQFWSLSTFNFALFSVAKVCADDNSFSIDNTIAAPGSTIVDNGCAHDYVSITGTVSTHTNIHTSRIKYKLKTRRLRFIKL